MELPNYSRQLMQQLQTFRKDSLFCDCTILVGDVAHPAHKVVLAATSLLFKSVLETSDSISIDTAVVTEQEFSSLLDMAYVGRLGPDKHDFTRVIAAADSLQMFDVAVGCKTILDQLEKQSEDALGLNHHTEFPLRQKEKPDCLNDSGTEFESVGHTDITERSRNRLSPQNDGAVELLSQKREDLIRILQDIQPWINVLRTWNTLSNQQQKMLLRGFEGDPDIDVVFQRLLDQVKDGCELTVQAVVLLLNQIKSLKADLGSVEVQEKEQTETDHKITGGSVPEVASSSGSQHEVASDLKDLLTGKRTDDRIGVSLLRTYRNRLCALNLEAQLIRRSLEEGPSIPSDQREVLLKEVDGNMEKLLGAAVNGGLVQPLTVWRLLFWAATHSPELHPIMQEIRAKPDAQELMHMVGRVDALFKHKKLILETLNKIPEPDSDSGNDITVFLHSCHTADGGTESMQQVLERVLGRELQHVRPLCHLLSASHASFPQLSVLIQELGRVMAHNEEIAASEEEEKEKKKEDRTHRRRKGVVVSYSCQWCNKTFDFKCRLLKHKKQCMFSPDRVQRCTECSATFPSITALQQHRAEVHDGPPVKKKKVEPVTCELCGKTFKHPSGLLYHKRTEHLEERPYECEECGVKFAANSSLKNHMRLHTGEKPYHCKHCDMSFAVAAALSYHTKKKHAEGKMYSCQYCSATFAQSIELTRHVRTHTGDKPYVCRECGKGFKQANGLSVHLQTFHNIADPHDCQKCRVSLGSLEKLREHILEVHPKEMHQCPECNKILNTAAQLDKHMSVHDGSKPYSCQSCHKSYQTLSGLWYHNRTTHPDVMTTEGSRSNSHLIHCKICDKSFCNRSSLFKHNITKHSGE